MSSHGIVSILLPIGSPLQAIGKCEHTFTVITEAHLGLAETNGVLPLANAIVLLQLSLVNALERKKLV